MERTRRQLLDYIAREVSTADLERINTALPYILQEAVRELNGEVEYRMVTADAEIVEDNRG